MAKGHGVPARRVEDCEGLAKALDNGLHSKGPNLIQVVL
jgi:thiamine pyrophosphate-dependent acetolactate synthase large subunit-like protein